jgi:hypothetical protein
MESVPRESTNCQRLRRVRSAVLGLRHGPIEFPSCLDPLVDHDLDVGNRLLVASPISSAAGELRDLGDVCVVLIAPVEDNLVAVLTLRHDSLACT